MTMTKTRAPVRTSIFSLIPLLLIAAPASAPAAGADADFRAAFAAAEAAEQEAGHLRNQWTVTVAALADAKKAADRGDFGQASALAKEAEALAKASISQATSEKEAWNNLEIR
jgi:hypothetical protein